MYSPVASCDESIVLMSDKRLQGISVFDNAEPLVDLFSRSSLLVDEDGWFTPEYSDTFSLVRLGIARRLEVAQSKLPEGVSLLIKEGHRSIEYQTDLFASYRNSLRQQFQFLSEEQLNEEASKYVALPDIAPHPTGGAVDVTLVNSSTGEELDMGSPFNGDPVSTKGASYTLSSQISQEASRNRQVLISAMSDAGFVNYPTEWWHWSYGDRYWALKTSRSRAKYGVISVA